MSLREVVERMAGVRALVLGDPINDVYHFGRVERLCPEAPVPVFIEESHESRAGGAANVEAQMLSLLCGVGTGWEPLFYDWTQKYRYVVGTQLLMRVDVDRCVKNSLPETFRSYSVVVISDYGKGACTLELCRAAISLATAAGIPVIVDPKGSDWSKYEGATWICPNEKELEAWDRKTATTVPRLVKCGSKGLYLHGQHVISFPAKAQKVFDVTGAGDTVVAVFAAALGAGATTKQGAELANLAAGYVVGEIGTAVCPRDKLLELVEAL